MHLSEKLIDITNRREKVKTKAKNVKHLSNNKYTGAQVWWKLQPKRSLVKTLKLNQTNLSSVHKSKPILPKKKKSLTGFNSAKLVSHVATILK